MEMNTAAIKKKGGLESEERTRQDKENDKNNALQGVMKRNRGERETSEAFKQRGGATPDIKRVKPKNVRNERDRKTKKQKRGRAQSQQFALPDLYPYRAKSRLVGRTSWLCTCLVFNLSKGMTFFCISLCRKRESLRGQYLDHCCSAGTCCL